MFPAHTQKEGATDKTCVQPAVAAWRFTLSAILCEVLSAIVCEVLSATLREVLSAILCEGCCRGRGDVTGGVVCKARGDES